MLLKSLLSPKQLQYFQQCPAIWVYPRHSINRCSNPSWQCMLCRTLFRCNCWVSLNISWQYTPEKTPTPFHPMYYHNSPQGWLSSDSTDSSPISLHPSVTDSTTARVDSVLCVRNQRQFLQKSRCLHQIPVSSHVRNKHCSRIPLFTQHFRQRPWFQSRSSQKICLRWSLLRPLSWNKSHRSFQTENSELHISLTR